MVMALRAGCPRCDWKFFWDAWSFPECYDFWSVPARNFKADQILHFVCGTAQNDCTSERHLV